MFIAHLSTVHAKFSIGLIGLEQHEMQGALTALVSTLAKLNEPIVLTSTNTVVREAPDDAAATLKFRYLGVKSVKFADQADFIVSVNLHLDCGIFECPDIFDTAPDGTFTAVCQYFVRVEVESPLGAAPTLH